ncbi:hypothetical protein F5J12DRAFT_680892, partial [Pisolithus orientalis]|uniref:uncharacterized protein n=1 Tax=Pisolithus orientalis TaxID=936130 RepID=UPI002224B817
ARGDAISMLDIIQRHHDVLFCKGDITDEWDVSDVLKESGTTCIVQTASPQDNTEDPSIYYKVNIKGTQAITAGVHRLIYKTFMPGDCQVMASLYQAYQCSQTHIQIDDNNNLFDYNNVRNATQVHLLTVDKLVPPPSYSSTMLGKPKLYPEKLNKSLHCTPPPIYATTEYHHMPPSPTQPLSPYVTPHP